VGVNDVGGADVPIEGEDGAQDGERAAPLIDADHVDTMRAEEIVEASTAAAQGHGMAEPGLGTGQIDGGMDIAVEPLGVVQDVQDPHPLRHRKIARHQDKSPQRSA
jgi:hypothetical protein